MKKRILSILLTLCMVLMLVPATAFADEGYYTITQSFKYGAHQCAGVKVETSPYTHEETAIATFSLGDVVDCAPYKFVGWKETGSGTVYGPYASILPESDLTFEAVYEVDGSLAITVEGFQVGNTPGDCTYTVESTIPGVTFSADDIRGAYWANSEDQVHSANVFEADTDYLFSIVLNNNGLELVPAATVNGIAPFDIKVVAFDGVPYAISIGCLLGTLAEPTPIITIDGANVVCAQQDYEFTATPSAGVTLDETFGYDTGLSNDSVELTIDEDGVGHGVVSAKRYDLNTNYFDLYVHGTTAGGGSVSETMCVQISQDHIYEDGVCGCGAVRQYTITYDGGEEAEGSIPAGTKKHGEDFTLSSKTFTWDGFVQTGWMDEYYNEYELGGAYTLDEDMTFYPIFEKLVTVTADFTTTVALGDAGEPGEKTFTLALIGDSAPDMDKSNVTITGSVTTDGAGDYDGTLTITGPERTLWYMLSEGAFVQQVDDGEAAWTVDDTVWGLLMSQAELSEDAATGYAMLVVPASIDEFGYYYIDWENLQTADMTFTNTYTAHAYALNHDADGHWDECTGCKDKQNEEPHRYGDWTVTREATQTEEGQRERICAVCGYKQTETIPVLPHTHAYTQKHDATDHWEECGCGDIRNKELHQYGDWTVTKEATQTAKGEKEHTCTVCGYTEKAEIAKLTAADTTDSTKANAGTGATTSPKTGDNSQMAMWIALLFMGGAAVIGTTVYGKKKSAR